MARSFNGTSDKIAPTLSVNTNTLTIGGWALFNSLGSYDPIIVSRTSLFAGLILSSATGNPLTSTWRNVSPEYDAATGLTITTGLWTYCAMVVTPTSLTTYRQTKGGTLGSYTINTTYNAQAESAWYLGADPTPARFLNGNLAEFGMWTNSLTQQEIQALANGCLPYRIRPASLAAYWPLWGLQSPEPDLSGAGNSGTLTGTAFATHAPVSLFLPPVNSLVTATGGGTTYTLNASPGNFALTGASASLLHGYVFNAAPGSFALNGPEAALLHDRVLVASPGSYNLSGQAAGLPVHRMLTAGIGGFQFNGATASFLLGYTLDAQSGTLLLSGADATFVTPRFLAASPGSFQLTSAPAALEVNRVLNASPGAFSLIGAPAQFLLCYTLDAQPGSFHVSGDNVALLVQHVLNGQPGSFLLTGAVADFLLGYTLDAQPGTFSLTGTPGSFLRGCILPALPGVLVLSGDGATFVYKPLIAATIQLLVSSSRQAIFTMDKLMATRTDLTCPRGQARIWTASFTTPTAIAGWTLVFTVKDVIGNILLQLNSASGAINVVDPVNGAFTLTVTAAQMLLPAQQGEWDVWRTDAGFEDKLGYGIFTVLPSVRV